MKNIHIIKTKSHELDEEDSHEGFVLLRAQLESQISL